MNKKQNDAKTGDVKLEIPAVIAMQDLQVQVAPIVFISISLDERFDGWEIGTYFGALVIGRHGVRKHTLTLFGVEDHGRTSPLDVEDLGKQPSTIALTLDASAVNLRWVIGRSWPAGLCITDEGAFILLFPHSKKDN